MVEQNENWYEDPHIHSRMDDDLPPLPRIRNRASTTYRRESEQRFRALFEHAAVGMACINTEGRWLEVNQKLCSIVGYTRPELLERTVQDIMYVNDLDAGRHTIAQLLSGELETCSLETRYISKARGPIWVNVTFSLVRDVAARPAYFVAVIEDIDRRKSNQAEIASIAEGNRLMEEFLGMASHELRTPLTTIKANIQLAQRRLKALLKPEHHIPEESIDKVNNTADMLQRAEQQVRVLNRLVGDMIDISRIQSGKLQLYLRPEPGNLVAMVRAAVTEQRKATPQRTIHLSISEEYEIPVIADRDRIVQVVTNYMGNALKYSSPDQPVEVSVSFSEEATDAEPRRATVFVRDYGPGLPVEEQSKIWESFYQAPDVTVLSGSGVGLGLGLFISKALIEGHQGQVGVESTPGVGSTFWFTLPLAAPAHGEPEV